MACGAVPLSCDRLHSIPAQLSTSIPCYFLLIISCCSPGGDLPPFGLFPRSHRTNGFTKQQQHRQVFLTAELKKSTLLCFCPSGAAALAPVHVPFSHDTPVIQLQHIQLSSRSIKTQNSVVCLQTPCFLVFFHQKITLILKK